MPVVTLDSKGQLIIPAALRRRFGLKAGARVSIDETPDGLVLRPETTGLPDYVPPARKGWSKRTAAEIELGNSFGESL